MNAFRLLLLFSFIGLITPLGRSITMTFSPQQRPGLLDVTIDVSDGHWVLDEWGFRNWVYDGPGYLDVTHDGWRIKVSAPDSGWGMLSIRVPDQFGYILSPPSGLSYMWFISELSDGPGSPETPYWALGDGDWASEGTWAVVPQPPKPIVQEVTISSYRITWNVPDSGNTFAFLSSLIVAAWLIDCYQKKRS